LSYVHFSWLLYASWQTSFGGRRVKLMGGDWQEIKKGKHGAMLLRLAENVQHASQLADPTFDLVCEEDDHDEVENFEAYLKDMHAHSATQNCMSG
jgi:hypothetical protein